MENWKVNYIIEAGYDHSSGATQWDIARCASLQRKLVNALEKDELKPQSVEVIESGSVPTLYSFVKIVYIVKAETQFESLAKSKKGTSMLSVLEEDGAKILRIFADKIKRT